MKRNQDNGTTGHHRQASGGKPGYEISDVKVLRLLAYGFAVALTVTAALVGLNELLITYREKWTRELVGKVESAELRSLRAREAEILGTYAVLDSARGVVRVPIERAMQLLAERRGGRSGLNP